MPKNRSELESTYSNACDQGSYRVMLSGRYEKNTAQTVPGFLHFGKASLLYELDVLSVDNETSYLSQYATCLWFDGIPNKTGDTFRAAYEWVLDVKEDLRGQGAGSFYFLVQTKVLPRYGVSQIWLSAEYFGPRFWKKRGFKFVDDTFWLHYDEYCEFNSDAPKTRNVDEVPVEYFNELRGSGLKYSMVYNFN
ncbi:MAG: hypothetical protein PHH36_00800 [Sideroxydans sp.]|nr:hypothetical protein [Sideroxydans sp.]